MRKAHIILVLFFTAAIVQAQENQSGTFLKRLQEFNEETTSIVSDFDQVQEFSFLDETMEASGKFYFVKPGKMKWEQIKPEAYTFVIKSEEAYKVQEGKKQNIPVNSPQIAGFRSFLLTTMDGSILQSEEFDSQIFFNQSEVLVKLFPRQRAMKRMFQEVNLVFDEKTLLLQELTFFETEEDFRRIRFSNHELNTLKPEGDF